MPRGVNRKVIWHWRVNQLYDCTYVYSEGRGSLKMLKWLVTTTYMESQPRISQSKHILSLYWYPASLLFYYKEHNTSLSALSENNKGASTVVPPAWVVFMSGHSYLERNIWLYPYYILLPVGGLMNTHTNTEIADG